MKALLCLLAVTIFVNLALYPQDPDKMKELKSIICDANIPGIQLIFSSNGKKYEYVAGVVMNNSEKNVTPNTIFEAASLGKTVFAYAVLRLYDRGVIDLDAPLLKITGSYPRFDPANPLYSRITARMVLRHTTGLPNWGNDSLAVLMFPPDSCFSYSGEGYLYLQRVLESITGKPLNQIMQEEVFIPLGMTSSSYVWVDRFDTVSSFGSSPEEIKRHGFANAAYSLLTTAGDYSRFLDALARGEGLKPSTHLMMLEKSVQARRFGSGPNTADPYISWGLGVGIQENEEGKAIWHWGDNGNFKCFYIVYPDKNESLIYFTHSSYGLLVNEDILNLFMGPQSYWIVRWLGFGYDSPVAIRLLRTELSDRGYEDVTGIINDIRKGNAAYQFSERDLNELGFLLMKKGQTREAVAIFRANLDLNPGSPVAYDSLAEGYEASGDIEPALKNFRIALELNPKNNYAAERIRKLEKKQEIKQEAK